VSTLLLLVLLASGQTTVLRDELRVSVTACQVLAQAEAARLVPAGAVVRAWRCVAGEEA
jgi:hypothetical protein